MLGKKTGKNGVFWKKTTKLPYLCTDLKEFVTFLVALIIYVDNGVVGGTKFRN